MGSSLIAADEIQLPHRVHARRVDTSMPCSLSMMGWRPQTEPIHSRHRSRYRSASATARPP